MISGSSTQKLRIQALTDAGGGGGELFEFVRDGNNVEKFQGAKSAVPWFVVDNNIKKLASARLVLNTHYRFQMVLVLLFCLVTLDMDIC